MPRSGTTQHTHPINTHPINTHYQHTLSIHPINTPCQHTLSTHPDTQSTLSIPPYPLPQPLSHPLSTHTSRLCWSEAGEIPTQPSLNPSLTPFLTPSPPLHLGCAGLRLGRSFAAWPVTTSSMAGTWMKHRASFRRVPSPFF